MTYCGTRRSSSVILFLRILLPAFTTLRMVSTVAAFTISTSITSEHPYDFRRGVFPHGNSNYILPPGMPFIVRLSGSASSNEEEELEECDDDYEDDDDDYDDDVPIKPYGNRSMAWTRRYRRLNPYEKVRNRVLTFGHRHKEDWDDCVASGLQGAYVPQRPDEMYADQWVSWDEFLGVMRSYEDTRQLAVNVLGLKSLDEYIIFVRSDPKRAQGLRIPVRPDLKYKNDGWIDEATFFTKGDT